MHFNTMINDTITNDTMSNDLMINPSRIRSSAASVNNEDPLCCCEYRADDGSTSHILTLCCNCEDFDSLVDGLIQGEGIHEGRLTGFMSTVESRVRIPWRGGAVRLPLDKLIPVILVPAFLWVSSIHPVLLFILILILPLILYSSARSIVRYRPESRVFLYTSYTVSATFLSIYQIEVVGFSWISPHDVSPLQNILLVVGSLTSIFLFILVRRLKGIPVPGEKGKYCR
ncbi:palmitoyltransferase ZDHHC23 isoform X2 [Eurytemora carolleeae]|uniref:palmitoyltransferase ZDHHC23 isoform X2 n=1 Tax=Eurytemora carolleeae TaxID=1294199 RepID=UPI000C76F790|nr:palmitoyltransferase ZDHHC23 isoform X2 [Eurytemora carolleeae]|eukprot:XP_023347256.1 palmitoyltransferase ZDHHC23-like isoform X2 [Eurytemora affinis]